MAKAYVKHDYAVTGRDYVETEGGDTPAGGISYSTEEQDTGLTWIDGSKIYQKTFTSSYVTVSGTNWQTTDIDVSGLGITNVITGNTLRVAGALKVPLAVAQYAISGENRLQIIFSVSTPDLTLDSITLTYTKTE